MVHGGMADERETTRRGARQKKEEEMWTEIIRENDKGEEVN